MGKNTLYPENSIQSRGMLILGEIERFGNGGGYFFYVFLGKISVYNFREWAMLAIVLVLGAKILINLHQPLNLFLRM
jgi:hypothetical protein